MHYEPRENGIVPVVGTYLPRLVDPWLARLLAGLPALMITGARATGKTTTALRHAAEVVRLDVGHEATPFRADPDAALRNRREPLLLDEWQECADVLGAVKRAVDQDRRPGRFILTGSVRAETDPRSWPGVGRVVTVEMHPLTVREQLGYDGPLFLDRLLGGELPGRLPDAPDLRDYVGIALRGGFPDAATESDEILRGAWLADYARRLGEERPGPPNGVDGNRLGRFLNAYALNSAGIVTDNALWQTAGINRRTADSYVRLLTNLGVIAEVPAWSSNRLKRLTRGPKRFIADAGLWGAITDADEALVMSDGNLLGRLIETFVTSQLRAELSASARPPRLYHLRDGAGRHEVDLIIDLGHRGLVALEIEAKGAVGAADARHLVWLRDQLGDQVLAAAVFHTGPARYRLADGVDAIPICALWT
ncbi:MAG: ATP-binding protein [Acidimicrobiia bacterium]|nr:ATP-binding protein [Acidimicrobiia bacterium]